MLFDQICKHCWCIPSILNGGTAPGVSCLHVYALQIGAQCQRPSFPLPSRLAMEESAATVFSRSRLLLFLLFTRVRLNITKRGMQIAHTTKPRPFISFL